LIAKDPSQDGWHFYTHQEFLEKKEA